MAPRIEIECRKSQLETKKRASKYVYDPKVVNAFVNRSYMCWDIITTGTQANLRRVKKCLGTHIGRVIKKSIFGCPLLVIDTCDDRKHANVILRKVKQELKKKGFVLK